MNQRGSFLRADTRSWVSSSLFFMSMHKLGVNEERYYLPVGFECNNKELTYYVDHLLDEISKLEFEDNSAEEFKANREYVRKIAFILRAWARDGQGLKVV